MRYFIKINYDGTTFKGWQIQPNDVSVQEEIEKVLSIILNQPTTIVGCGRTDAGVHAKNYIAHFDYEQELPKKFILRINKMLPSAISITSIKKVNKTAHARFDAATRTYKYFINFKKDPFLNLRSYWIHSYEFNLDKMNDAAQRLLSYTDFTTFEKKGSDNKTSLCKIYDAKWEVIDENQWCFTITANRFLRNMVRRITGTLLMVGLNRITIDEIESALNKRDILEVNIAPPAHGLFLWEITYPTNIYID